jgi:hypothetical protein
MCKFTMLATAGTLVLAGGLAWAEKTRVNPRRPNPVVPFDSSDASQLSGEAAAQSPHLPMKGGDQDA